MDLKSRDNMICQPITKNLNPKIVFFHFFPIFPVLVITREIFYKFASNAFSLIFILLTITISSRNFNHFPRGLLGFVLNFASRSISPEPKKNLRYLLDN